MKRRSFLKHSAAFGTAALATLHSVHAAAIPGGYASVKNYGAKGDGRTDDSAAIQKALNESMNVWIPAGTYLVGNLKLKNGQTVAGEGATSILRQRVGAQYCLSANPGREGYADPSKNLGGISVLDLRFEGQAGNVAFNEHIHLLNLNGVSDTYVAGCQFVKYVGDGIYLGSSNAAGLERHNERVTIRRCSFDGVVKSNRNGISIIDGTDIKIEECTFTRSGRSDMPGGIDLEPDGNNDSFSRIRRITISKCTFTDMGAGALIAVFLRPNDALRFPSQDITITDCKGYGNGQAGQSALSITQNSWSSTEEPTANTAPLNLVVSNCYFENIYRPIVMTSTKGVRIENTTFFKSAAFGYLGSGDNTGRNRDVLLKAVSFKQIGMSTSVGVAGLRVYGNDHITLDGCSFEDCGPSDGSGGLALNFAGSCSSSYVSLLNTKISSPLKRTKYAIRVYASHKLTPSTNQQSGTALSGVAGNDFRT